MTRHRSAVHRLLLKSHALVVPSSRDRDKSSDRGNAFLLHREEEKWKREKIIVRSNCWLTLVCVCFLALMEITDRRARYTNLTLCRSCVRVSYSCRILSTRIARNFQSNESRWRRDRLFDDRVSTTTTRFVAIGPITIIIAFIFVL